jgi:GTP-binding protein
MSLPEVAIVGRPNVGKSTLFNRIAKRRISIVAPEEGVTRDRVCTDIEAGGKHFQLADTAGAFLSAETDVQREKALENACVVLLVVDVSAGLLPADESMARTLKKSGLKTILLVNKADNPQMVDDAGEFHKLGIRPVIPCSAKHGLGMSDLMTSIIKLIPETDFVPQHEIDVAIVGRRNTGKSTLLNRIAGEDRVVVSDEPGTTRDNIDFTVNLGGRPITFIDTAGMLCRNRIRNGVEFYSIVRSREAVERCSVCLFILDCTLKIGRVELTLASHIAKCRKPCILVFNKWDIPEAPDTARFENYISRRMPLLSHCPVTFTSALTGFNTKRTLKIIPELYDISRTQISTPAINKAVRKIVKDRPPPARGGKSFKMFYGTQTAIQPPTFTLFVNEPKLIGLTYRRFLERSLREAFELEEIPISLRLRSRR